MSEKKILYLTINFPPNQSVGTHRVAKILKFIDGQKFRFFVLTLKEKYYNAEAGQSSGDDKKIPASVQVFRTDRWDLTYVFTMLKHLVRKIIKHSAAKNNGQTSKPQQLKTSSKQTVKSKKIIRFIYRLRDFVFSVFEFPDKYIGWFPKAVRQGIKIVKENKIDFILTTAPPHSLFIMAVIIKKITGVKLVLDFRDPWALSRWDKGNFIRYYLEHWLESYVLKNADLMLFVTENLRDEYIKNYTGIDKDKFILFSNGFDPDDFPPVPTEKREKKDFVRFVHLGTLYKKRNPMHLIIALNALKETDVFQKAPVRLEFIGSIASELNWLPHKIKQLGLEDIVTFIPPVSFKDSIKTMYAADVLVIIQPGTDLQIPAKIFEYMYTGKPIFAVVETDSASDRLIAAGNLGKMAPADNPQQIEQSLREMLTYIHEEQKPNWEYIQSYNYSKYISVLEKYLQEV